MASQQPKSVVRARRWDKEVEEAYRFQLAGFRDEKEYLDFFPGTKVDRWPDGEKFVKKLKRRDGYFYYYNRCRECNDRDVHRTKIYGY
ncbi:meiosis expressed gene 1 protein homolog [Corticium candelabrum]|uniref:meiosis expressed gene 1 protein homolog n=1 Tax=Corticium candelabrum TaxID=121492 RepID=UPI002E362CAF|nr:meiosis expressed gene 1 protein homolog [Corticium candelabrum]